MSEGTRQTPRPASLVLVFLLLVLSAACTTYRREGAAYLPSAAAEGEEEYRRGVQAQQEHRNDEALALFARVSETYPKSLYADDALYRAGLIFMQMKDYDDADDRLTKLVTRYPDSPMAKDGWYKLGLVRFEAGNYEGSIEAMRSYLGSGEGLNLVGRAQAHIAKCYAILRDYPSAFDYYQQAYVSTRADASRRIVLTESDALLSVFTRAEDLLEVVKKLGPGPIRDRLQLRLADLYAREGKDNQASTVLESVKEGSTSGEVRAAAARERLSLATDEFGEGPAIGLVLPLSGKYAVYGRQVLTGALLGIGFFEDLPEGKAPPRILVEDSAGEQDMTTAAVTRLARNRNVVCVIALVMSGAAQAAADAAEEGRVPTILMTRKEGVTEGRHYVFRHFLTDSQQVRILVAEAARSYGARRFGVLFPRERWAEEFRDLFIQEVKRQGFELVATAGYDAKTTDFRREIGILRAGGGLDAVFLPEHPDRVMMIAPQLVYHGLGDTLLLGTSEWNSAKLAQSTSTYLSTALFADGFFDSSLRPEAAQFVERCRAFGEEQPTALAAFGYDNVRLAGWLIQAQGAATRDSFRGALLAVKDLRGASGTIAFLPNGEAEKDLYLLRIRNRRVEEVQ